MPRTPVKSPDLVSLIVTALNGQTVNGGTLKAVADGSTIKVTAHSDGAAIASTANYEVVVH